jgi:hypothetical protein
MILVEGKRRVEKKMTRDERVGSPGTDETVAAWVA